MFKRLKWFGAGLALFAGFPVLASMTYVAPASLSNWKMAVDTPIECRLEHEIPVMDGLRLRLKPVKK